jgi:sulfate/thiosulfate transport system ATP-binding protein
LKGLRLRIQVVDITKEFGRTGALRGVSLDIKEGELIALLGPSGSGKTTLLRVIAGLETPSAGKIFFGDEDATGVPVQRRRIGFVFQNYALFKHMSVRDNIAFGLRIPRRDEQPSQTEIRNRVQDLLDLVQLSGIGDRYPRQLSGGQQQRVALARALAVEPRVLLLDEPFGALDARVRKDLRRWLRELHDRTGHTTVFVTHDQEEALELADRVAVLNAGKLEQVGTADEVYDHPASAFVMSFVGDTSSIPVEFDGKQLLHNGRPFQASFEGTCHRYGRLYVRPRDIEIVDAEVGDLVGTVVNVHRTVAGRRAQITLSSTDTVIEADVGVATTLINGDRVGLRLLNGRAFSELAGEHSA